MVKSDRLQFWCGHCFSWLVLLFYFISLFFDFTFKVTNVITAKYLNITVSSLPHLPYTIPPRTDFLLRHQMKVPHFKPLGLYWSQSVIKKNATPLIGLGLDLLISNPVARRFGVYWVAMQDWTWNWKVDSVLHS